MYLSAYNDAGDDIHVVCGDPCAFLNYGEKAVGIKVVVSELLRDDVGLAVFEIDPDLLFLLFVLAHAFSFICRYLALNVPNWSVLSRS